MNLNTQKTHEIQVNTQRNLQCSETQKKCPHTFAVEIRNYTFFYEYSTKKILDSINLTIDQGKVVVIGGPSGSGKSTLLKSMIGYIYHNIKGKMKGEIRIFGKKIMDYSQLELSELIGLVFQNPEEQLVTFTVFDEIAFSLENLCLSPEEIIKRTQEIARKLEITHLLERNITSLSGGEKKKVIIATALVKSPQILLLDEPLAFLDSESELNLIEILKTIKKEYDNITIIIVEHRLDSLKDITDEIYMLDKFGKLTSINPPIYTRYDMNSILSKPSVAYSITQFTQKSKSSIIETEKKERSPIIKLKNVSFAYSSRKIFSNLNFSIEKAEILGIIGSNGIGKTTLMYLITKILIPQSGEIFLYDKNIYEYSEIEYYSKIGYIFQNPETQIFETTVKDEIMFGPRNFGIINKTDERKQPLKSKSLLEKYCSLIAESRISIEEIQTSNPFRLSWGQKRRVNIASILSYNPDLILLDEPFIGQDAQITQEIVEILKTLRNEGKTIVIVSHDLQYLEENCDRIINLNEIKHSESNSENSETIKQAVHSEEIPTIIESNLRGLKDKKKEKKKKRKLTAINSLIIEQLSEKQQNILHSINPNIKMLFIICLTVSIFLQNRIEIIASYLLIPFFLVLLAKINIMEFLRKLKWILWLTLIYIFINAFFDAQIHPEDEILFVIFGLPVRTIAFFYALRTGVITITLFSTALIFTKTTPVKHIIYGLMQIGIPYRYAFAFMIGLRYVPLIEQESSLIEIAQKLRGLGITSRSNPKKVFKHIFHRISILLINMMRKTATTAIALEYRNFGRYHRRTNLFKMQLKGIDVIAIVFSLLLLFLNTFQL